MKNFLKEVAALKFTPWYRWHPQLAIRYLPVAERIKKLKRSGPGRRQGQGLSILEVGSGGLGIAPYLKMPVTGVDIKFEPPFHPLLKRVKGSADNLKFDNDSFEAVASVDMLEHLPKEKRRIAVREMIRVAGKLVIIGAPGGKRSAEHDLKISHNYIKRRKAGYKFAHEHIELGLPEEVDILRDIKAAAKELKKKIKIETKGNMNIKLRAILMRGWASNNIFANILFRKVFLALIPVFRWWDKPPFYRKIFFVTIKSD